MRLAAVRLKYQAYRGHGSALPQPSDQHPWLGQALPLGELWQNYWLPWVDKDLLLAQQLGLCRLQVYYQVSAAEQVTTDPSQVVFLLQLWVESELEAQPLAALQLAARLDGQQQALDWRSEPVARLTSWRYQAGDNYARCWPSAQVIEQNGLHGIEVCPTAHSTIERYRDKVKVAWLEYRRQLSSEMLGDQAFCRSIEVYQLWRAYQQWWRGFCVEASPALLPLPNRGSELMAWLQQWALPEQLEVTYPEWQELEQPAFLPWLPRAGYPRVVQEFVSIRAEIPTLKQVCQRRLA